jgi:SH3-like domain-containing protein
MSVTRRAVLSSLAILALTKPALAAAEISRGPVTDLPLPRYVSLKTDRVNLREGPSKEHRTRWVFQRAGLPVEIVAEYETWRRIRDAEGAEGWVLHSLLSGRRTALVMPWAKAEAAPVTLFERAADDAEIVARLLPNVIINVRQCSGSWCRVTVINETQRDIGGYIRQDKLWGVYPNERLD